MSPVVLDPMPAEYRPSTRALEPISFSPQPAGSWRVRDGAPVLASELKSWVYAVPNAARPMLPSRFAQEFGVPPQVIVPASAGDGAANDTTEKIASWATRYMTTARWNRKTPSSTRVAGRK